MELAPNERKARNIFKRLARKRKAKCRGYVIVGKTLKKFWATFPIPVSKLQHEYEVSKIRFALLLDEARRGSQVDERYEFDLEAKINDSWYGIECDRGTEGYCQVSSRMAAMAGWARPVLWVVKTPRRMERFMELADGNKLFWFTLYDRLLADPHGSIWTTGDAQTKALEASRMPQRWVGPRGPTHG